MSEEYGLTSVPDWAIRNSFTRIEDLEEALEKTNKTLDHVYLMAQHQSHRVDYLEEIIHLILDKELMVSELEIQTIEDIQKRQKQLQLHQPKD